MITLITGTPGAGKTLYAVHAILSEEGKGSRPIYVDGIPELKTRHEPAQDINQWHKWAPDGSLICIDEVQRVWRPLPAGARVPESISELETHRHRGIDFVLITQHPNLVHSNVRKLVGRHIHLRRTALGVYLYEWPEATNPEARGNAARIRWSHPKESFGLYKSASEHTKVRHRMPGSVYVFGMAVVLLLGGVAYMTHNVGTKAGLIGDKPDQALSPLHPPASGGLPPAPALGVDAPASVVNEALHRPDAFVPVVYGRPETAPAYHGVARVLDFPQVVGCVASRSRCACYTQQATRVDMTDELCRRFAEVAQFNPFAAPRETPSLKTEPPPAD